MAEPDKKTLKSPDWLNKEFIADALRQHEKFKNVDIVKCDIRAAVGASENYSSCLYRVSLDILRGGVAEESKVIVKTMPIFENVREFVTNLNFFDKEIMMLKEVLPKTHKVLEEVGITDKLCAEIYYDRGQPEGLVIMEDLCVDGFHVGDRLKGLNLDECKKVVEALAKLHVASVVIVSEEPSITANFEKCYWVNLDAIMHKFFNDSMDSLIRESATWYESRFTEKLKQLKLTIHEKVISGALKCDTDLNVLNHGDMWTNNMMFRHSEAQVEAVKFVDLQLACYNTPVLDLLYFIFTSPRNDVRLVYFDEIIETYHAEFVRVSNLLGVAQDFTLEKLRKDLSDRLWLGFGFALTVLPVTSAPKEYAMQQDEIDPEVGLEGAPLFRSPRYLEAMKDMLPYFEAKGLL